MVYIGELDNYILVNKIDSGTIYKDSKFSQIFNKTNTTMNKPGENDESNPLYNEYFSKEFKTKHLSYLPLWSSAVSHLHSENHPRANNERVENYFKQKKKDARDKKSEIGQFWHINVPS